MITTASPMVMNLWNAIRVIEPKALLGGTVPASLDAEQPHSYHRSWKDSPHDGGYSVHFYGDRNPRRLFASVSQYACALDVTLPTPELMERYTARLHRFCNSHGRVYWTHGLREYAGTLDGQTVFAYDTTIKARTYGWDSSHLWHIHLSLNRRYVNSPRIMKIADIFRA